MAEYDTKIEQEKEEAEELSKPDDDGWVTVNRAAKKPPAQAKKEQELNLKKSKGGKKKKKTEMKNFYAFQMKDEKLSRIQELRKKFEEDKQNPFSSSLVQSETLGELCRLAEISLEFW